jgi:hypothetical protein
MVVNILLLRVMTPHLQCGKCTPAYQKNIPSDYDLEDEGISLFLTHINKVSQSKRL